MKLPQISYYLLCILLLTSCKQFKALTARDDSSVKTSKSTKRSDVKFIDGISVTPGQVVTSKHTTGPVAPKSLKDNPYSKNTNTPSGDIERADWLQLKYAVMLDANVEKLT